MLKRIISIFSISLIITGSFFSVYNYKYAVYADTSTDEWTQVTTNEQLVEAFKYYCKSRDVTIEGSIADGVTSFTTKTFNGIVNTLGIDVNVLQANLKYQTDGNLGTKFLFNTLSIDAYNRIFAQFLQDNELAVGDENVNDNVYSGFVFKDQNDNKCLVFISTGSSYVDVTASNFEFGTPYIYDTNSLLSLYNSGTRSLTFNIYNTSVTNALGYVENSNYQLYYLGSNVSYDTSNGKIYGRRTAATGGNLYDGYPCILYINSANKFYYAVYTDTTRRWDNNSHRYTMANVTEINFGQNQTPQSCNVYIVSNTINNNNYEGDTVINNNGDTNNYYPDNPDTPDTPSIPDGDGWRDFELPEMPNDWLIYGMEKKFPFDIPFNILFALSLLNHEPEIPKFEGDIDLQVCTWHYDIDLTPFDDIATILRKFEVLAFIIGLAILTKNLINWG